MLDTFRSYWQLFGGRGLWFAAIQRLHPRRTMRVAACPRGIRHRVYLRLNTTDVPTYSQVFLSRQYDVPLSRPPRVIVDAGANIGLATIWFANKYPAARIFAIEPEASNFELLCKNTRNYPGVVPVHAALWGENAPVSIVDPGRGHWGFRVQSVIESPSSPRSRVRGMTLDCLVQSHDIESIDILKLDIEGSEKDVFLRSQSWMQKVNVIFVELHDKFRAGCRKAFLDATEGFAFRSEQGEITLAARAGWV